LTARPSYRSSFGDRIGGLALPQIEAKYDPAKDIGAPAPVLTKAVEEQLGLKLVPAREAVKILIVDHADAEPVEN
jgi:uncharacterized protein (TIGR03435 family)